MNGALVSPLPKSCRLAPSALPASPQTCGSAAELPVVARAGAGRQRGPPGPRRAGGRGAGAERVKPRVMNGSCGHGDGDGLQPSCQAATLAKGTRLQNKSDRPCAAPGSRVCRGAKAGAGHLPAAGSRISWVLPCRRKAPGVTPLRAGMCCGAREGKAWIAHRVGHREWSPWCWHQPRDWPPCAQMPL